MTKIYTTFAIALAATCLFFVDAAFAGRPGERQISQQERIQQGVISGEITPKEYRILQHEQAEIQRSKRQAWSDGHLTKNERIRLERQQNEASRHIYRAKHNNADRN